MSHVKDFSGAGRRISELRGAMTQAEFAARLGVDRKTVVRWEAGERLPDGMSLLALVSEYQADVNYILTGQSSSVAVPLAPDEAALLDNYRNSPPAGRDALKATSAALAQCPSKTRKRAA